MFLDFILDKIILEKFICIIILSFNLLCCLCNAETNGFSFQYLEKNHKILKLECDGSVFVRDDVVTYITIYNGTSNTSLAEMKVGDCPIVWESLISKYIYTVACTQGKDVSVPVLKLIITDLKLSVPQTFGCNISTLGKFGGTTRTTWTVNVDKTDLEPLSSERAAESRGKPKETPATLLDSSFAVYVMGVTILSLALGLLSALCYIGLRSLKRTRTSESVPTRTCPSRPNDDTDLQNENTSESENGPDVGSERTLMCPGNNFRRPSNQDYSEALSPTPSALSDYIGFDFMQAQLSCKIPTAFSLGFSGVNWTKNSQEFKSPLLEHVSRSHDTHDVEAGLNSEVSDGRSLCILNSTDVVLEYATPPEQKFPKHTLFSRCKSYNFIIENVNREIVPQRRYGLAGS